MQGAPQEFHDILEQLQSTDEDSELLNIVGQSQPQDSGQDGGSGKARKGGVGRGSKQSKGAGRSTHEAATVRSEEKLPKLRAAIESKMLLVLW